MIDKQDTGPKLPVNPDAEQMILGCIILDNAVAPQALYELSPDDFGIDSHKLIFEAMRSLDRAKRAINPLTLIDQLTTSGQLERVGGPGFISSLFDGVPRFSSIREYVRLAKEAAIKRKAIYLADWMMHAAQADDVSVNDLLKLASSKVQELESSQSVDDLISAESAIDRTLNSLEERWASGKSLIGLPTGISALDQILLGLRGGKVYLVAAAPSMGKTTLALNFGNNIITHSSPDRQPVGLVISLEMDVEELNTKLIGVHTRIDTYRIETGKLTPDEKRAVLRSADTLARMPLEYVEGFNKVTALSLIARVEKVRSRHGRIDFLIVDYLQLLDSDESHESENQKITEISRTLKRISLRYNIPVIVVSQLNRKYADRSQKDYQLSDLRGSGSIEQDADVVLFLMPEDWTNEDDPRRRLKVAKHRAGKKDQTIKLIFFGDHSRFEMANTESEPMYEYEA